jgi:hypothetical protein
LEGATCQHCAPKGPHEGSRGADGDVLRHEPSEAVAAADHVQYQQARLGRGVRGNTTSSASTAALAEWMARHSESMTPFSATPSTIKCLGHWFSHTASASTSTLLLRPSLRLSQQAPSHHGGCTPRNDVSRLPRRAAEGEGPATARAALGRRRLGRTRTTARRELERAAAPDPPTTGPEHPDCHRGRTRGGDPNVPLPLLLLLLLQVPLPILPSPPPPPPPPPPPLLLLLLS